MAKISVVLATFNEAANITRCLRAIQDIADEIVVVDGQSTDETLALIKPFGATVITTTNKPNFHINKQMAIEAATGDLILQLDADEVVDKTLKNFITRLSQDSSYRTTENAWWVKRKNYFLGKWLRKGGQYPDPVIRLFRSGTARLPMQDVHEQMEVDGEVGRADGHLEHYSNPTFAEYLRKFNTYTSFKASQYVALALPLSWPNHWRHLVWLPCYTFVLLYIRHRGYVDGLAGLVFALMSGLHHTISYLKYWEIATYGERTP